MFLTSAKYSLVIERKAFSTLPFLCHSIESHLPEINIGIVPKKMSFDQGYWKLTRISKFDRNMKPLIIALCLTICVIDLVKLILVTFSIYLWSNFKILETVGVIFQFLVTWVAKNKSLVIPGGKTKKFSSKCVKNSRMKMKSVIRDS